MKTMRIPLAQFPPGITAEQCVLKRNRGAAMRTRWKRLEMGFGISAHLVFGSRSLSALRTPTQRPIPWPVSPSPSCLARQP
jgi:hypothetical protein